ncbi:MAG TPA: nucleotidyltransferase [Jatrophihabitantaceae bacterium]|jgi:hypothetical protein
MSDRDELRDALKGAASALKAGGIPFALAGSYALWAHGGPEPSHDADIVVREPDADRVADVLRDAGLDVERPPEDWIVKAHQGDATVDVLHRLNGVPVDDAFLDRAEPEDVLGVRMPVLPATDVVVVKLRSFAEHYLDFATTLAAVRAVREQLDWPRIREETADNDFAYAFLVLLDRLGITG